MKPLSLFALAALAPTALNAAAWCSPVLAIPLCGGDGTVIGIALLPPAQHEDDGQQCAKGCHAGSSRKRALSGDFPDGTDC